VRVTVNLETEGPKGTIPFQRPGDSTMGEGELGAIEREAKNLPESMGALLEVGIYHGRTTCILAQVGPVTAVEWFGGNVELAPPEVRAHTGWDPDYQKRHLFANLDSIPGVRERVTILAGSSHDILPTLKGQSFRVALIDADKTEDAVLQDIRDIWPLIPPGGTLFLDDWTAFVVDEPEPGTVKRAWERFEKEQGLDLLVEILGMEPPDYKSGGKLARIRKPLEVQKP
jgi:Methyltransferase domain